MDVSMNLLDSLENYIPFINEITNNLSNAVLSTREKKTLTAICRLIETRKQVNLEQLEKCAKFVRKCYHKVHGKHLQPRNEINANKENDRGMSVVILSSDDEDCQVVIDSKSTEKLSALPSNMVNISLSDTMDNLNIFKSNYSGASKNTSLNESFIPTKRSFSESTTSSMINWDDMDETATPAFIKIDLSEPCEPLSELATRRPPKNDNLSSIYKTCEELEMELRKKEKEYGISITEIIDICKQMINYEEPPPPPRIQKIPFPHSLSVSRSPRITPTCTITNSDPIGGFTQTASTSKILDLPPKSEMSKHNLKKQDNSELLGLGTTQSISSSKVLNQINQSEICAIGKYLNSPSPSDSDVVCQAKLQSIRDPRIRSRIQSNNNSFTETPNKASINNTLKTNSLNNNESLINKNIPNGTMLSISPKPPATTAVTYGEYKRLKELQSKQCIQNTQKSVTRLSLSEYKKSKSSKEVGILPVEERDLDESDNELEIITKENTKKNRDLLSDMTEINHNIEDNQPTHNEINSEINESEYSSNCEISKKYKVSREVMRLHLDIFKSFMPNDILSEEYGRKTYDSNKVLTINAPVILERRRSSHEMNFEDAIVNSNRKITQRRRSICIPNNLIDKPEKRRPSICSPKEDRAKKISNINGKVISKRRKSMCALSDLRNQVVPKIIIKKYVGSANHNSGSDLTDENYKILYVNRTNSPSNDLSLNVQNEPLTDLVTQKLPLSDNELRIKYKISECSVKLVKLIQQDKSVDNRRNIDKTHTFKSVWKEYLCRICQSKTDNPTDHYVNEHSTESYISRLTANDILNFATSNITAPPQTGNAKIKLKFDWKCFLCLEELKDGSLLKTIYHLSTHTGEYSFQCDFCELVKPFKSDIQLHIENNRLPAKKKRGKKKENCGTSKITRQYRYFDDNDKIKIYYCKLCNFFQINKANVLKHLKDQHERTYERELHCTELIVLNIEKKKEKQKSNNSQLGAPTSTKVSKPLDDVTEQDIIENKDTSTGTKNRILNSKVIRTFCLFKCVIGNCFFATNLAEEFGKHLKSHQAFIFFCCYCCKSFSQSKILIEHIRNKHGHCRYQCNKCFYRSYNISNVLVHKRSCHKLDGNLDIINCTKAIPEGCGEFMQMCMCPVCSQLKIPFNSIKEHLSLSHKICNRRSLKAEFYCLFCKFSTCDKYDMKEHMSNGHSSNFLETLRVKESDELQMDSQAQSFSLQIYDLDNELKHVASKTVLEWHGQISDLNVMSESYLHRDIDTESFDHLLNKIPKLVKENIIDSVENRDGNIFKCTYCTFEKAYIEDTVIKYHKQLHKATYVHLCTMCEFTTTASSHMMEHINLMHTEKDVLTLNIDRSDNEETVAPYEIVLANNQNCISSMKHCFICNYCVTGPMEDHIIETHYYRLEHHCGICDKAINDKNISYHTSRIHFTHIFRLKYKLHLRFLVKQIQDNECIINVTNTSSYREEVLEADSIIKEEIIVDEDDITEVPPNEGKISFVPIQFLIDPRFTKN